MTIVVGSTIAYAAHRRGSAVRSVTQALTDQCTRDDAEERRLQERLQSIEKSCAALRHASVSRAAAQEGSVVAQKDGESGTSSKKALAQQAVKSVHRDDVLERKPELQVRMLASRRASLAARYGSFYRAAQLTPEQIEKLNDALMKRMEMSMDLRATERKVGKLPPEISREAGNMVRQGFIDVLGPNGVEQLERYERTIGIRESIVGAFAGFALLAGEPITAQQGETLVQLMSAASSSNQKGRAITQESVDWQAVFTQARGVLSPTQMELLLDLQTMNAAVSELRMLVNDWAKEQKL